MTDRVKNAPEFLVVEDEQVIADILRRVLTSEGFRVDVADNGEAAQSLVRSNHYDFCIIDIKMPVMNGDDFYHWLREEQSHLAEHVLFTTGDTMCIAPEGRMEHSGMPFLLKPFTPDELKSMVKRVTMEHQGPV